MHTYQLSFRQKQIKPNHNLLYFMFSFAATLSWMERERLFRYSSCAHWLEWDCSRLVKIHHRVHDGFGGIAVVHAAFSVGAVPQGSKRNSSASLFECC